MRLVSTAIARERDRDREREREREREGGEERRSERETNYGTARRICDPREQVRYFGPFDSDKAASPEFFLALGCRRRMRERESFHVVSPFVYHQAFVFCIRSNRSANRKILGLQQKNSCFCNCLSFHLHQDFLSFTTYHCWQRRDPFYSISIKISLSYSVHLWQTQDPFLSICIKKFSLVQHNCGKYPSYLSSSIKTFSLIQGNCAKTKIFDFHRGAKKESRMLGWLQEFCVLPRTAMPEERTT